LSAGLGVGTILPTNVYGVLYEIELGKTLEATLIATTPAIDVTNEMLNNYGEENMTLLHFDTPISLQNGKAYLAMIGSENGGNITVCALSGPSPAYTSFVQFLPGQWNTISQMPMVRMNFDPIESVTESSTDLVQLLLSPNPSTTYVQFNTEQSFANQTYVLYNLLGERILEGKSTFPRTSLDVSTLAPGAYQLICGNRQARFIKK
jgi:Secretion system C-terminal sorting domain